MAVQTMLLLNSVKSLLKSGQYYIPSHLSKPVADLISKMLQVLLARLYYKSVWKVILTMIARNLSVRTCIQVAGKLVCLL